MRGEDAAEARDTLSGLGASSIRESSLLGGTASSSSLRLEPIRPTLAGIPQSERMAALNPNMNMMNMNMHGGIPRPRRTSQDEIRALVMRATQALDRIVTIRESMEPYVDFTQFDKSGSTTSSTTSSSRTMARSRVRSSQSSGGLSDAPIVGRSLGDSHASSSELLDARSTGTVSTDSTSSSDEDARAARGSHTNPASASSSSLGSSSPSDHEEDEEHEEIHEDEQENEEDEEDEGFETSEDEMPPLKEARMQRLQSITVAFHEGLPNEYFKAITRFLHANIELKTRHSRFNFYKESFTGGDCVRGMIMSGFAADQPTALRYGNVLVKLGYIEHVSRTDDQLHNNKDNFYRFTHAVEVDENNERIDDAASRMSVNAANFRESVMLREEATTVEYDFDEASDEVHALVTEEALAAMIQVLHKALVRRNKLMHYKGFVGCFIGAVAVDMMRELHLATSLIDAVLIGQAMLDEKLIEPVASTITTFQDRCVFYRIKTLSP